ncbi:uncharacterized protein N7484_005383 [Penicillium longicatenatum]|uniref:uncharacterized protein n=1 Tax=Penicillium longicatenatum TaxID=1561947 RepID=UPI0025485BE4|nr:uncharacterized protein N7484_005383 [Penicillium longicatenatum]KAJ5642876.1 hypothetical protein N7484_005383 [Penicillium longicatenatum]
MSFAKLNARHIQNYSAATTLEPHWGYADRALPCTNDAGSCAYLDVVYASHDRGMLYTGILWCAIGGVLLIWALIHQIAKPATYSNTGTDDLRGLRRVQHTLASFSRKYLLPDAAHVIFGRTTRLQVLIVTLLAGYLLIFSFVGISYNTWITPVSPVPGLYQTRSSIGPWADRVGVFAFALTPLSVMLSSRESFLSLITGLPYQSFNFMHRWLGYIIFVQSSLHTIGWCIVELRLYQPQPSTGIEWITQTYMVWGIVAMFLLLLLFVLSTPWGIRFTGYETFRKLHYVLAMVYIGACWGHWKQLKCFLLPSLIFWFLDRGARLVRTAILHHRPDHPGIFALQAAEAAMTRFPDQEHGDVIRLDLENEQDPWAIGQHYYLCFTQCSIWQSHPFTPLNAPIVEKGKVRHSYLLRAKSGETKKVALLAAKGNSATPIIFTGAYGDDITKGLSLKTNIICIAGGTGITYVLPVLLELARQPLSPGRKIELIWAIRHTSDTAWISSELDVLRKVRKRLNLQIKIFATRDASSVSSSVVDHTTCNLSCSDMDEKVNSASKSSFPPTCCDCEEPTPVEKLGGGPQTGGKHPDLLNLINNFLENTVEGPTKVFASGPGGMISDLRNIIATCNSGLKVWEGKQSFDVDLVCDDRLEW